VGGGRTVMAVEEMVRHLRIPELPPHAQAVVRFVGVRHSTESFVVRVYLGRWSIETIETSSADVQRTFAGTVAVYGHGDVYGSQDQLDRQLAPFDAEVNLTPALARATQPARELTLTLQDAQRRRRSPELFRFSRAEVTTET
jgi:hypothetical protein